MDDRGENFDVAPGNAPEAKRRAEAAPPRGELPSLPGYGITEKIYESSFTVIFRGFRAADNFPLVLKALKPEVATVARTASFKRQFDILSRLSLPGVIKTYGLESFQGSPVILLEDIGGTSVRSLLELEPFGLEPFLQLAIELAGTVGALHRQGIVHKDISPVHIIWNPDTRQVRLIGFSLVDEVSPLSLDRLPQEMLEGTIAYLSPEQTGRLNRSVDYRTDFYSLGATFYHLLTGRPPFEAADALGLVHCHLAKTAVAPHRLNPALPEAVSGIVMKLLEKMPEKRYQSALGLKMDLEQCRDALGKSGAIGPLRLGERDIPERFRPSQRLYGREKERARLLDAFGRVAAGGKEIFFVKGPTGAGKSSLIHELCLPVAEKQGFFIEGKFDPMQCNVPYLGWIRAFRTLVNFLLMENEPQLAEHKKRILDACGGNGKVLTDVIPILEQVIGPQPPVPELSAAGAQLRFSGVFERFVKTIAVTEHPLVVFLDELQWIDMASLSLLRLLAGSADIASLLLIGAYRENETSARHPLPAFIEELRAGKVPHEVLSLENLTEENVNRLVADSLRQDPAVTAPLAKVIYSKTGGNAFFTQQMLRMLFDEGAISFSAEKRCWQWDLAAIGKKEIAEDAVALMAGKFRKLPPATQRVLTLGTCLGNQFELTVLSVIAQEPYERVLDELQPALQEGLVEIAEGRGRFVHDRVRQAVYAAMNEKDRTLEHLKIGRLLLTCIPEREREQRIFTIVNNFDLGVAGITDEREKTGLVQLNLAAGHRAKMSHAYASALQFLTQGIELLGPLGWEEDYWIAFPLHIAKAECEYLIGNHAACLRETELIIEHATTRVDKTAALLIRQQAHMAHGEIHKAVEDELRGLAWFGIELPLHPSEEEVRAERQRIARRIGARPIEALAELPIMKDQELEALMQITAAPTLFVDPNLCDVHVARMVALSLEHGNSATSAEWYGRYGMLLAAHFDEYEDACRFARMGYALMEKRNNFMNKARAAFFMTVTSFWTRSIDEFVAYARIGYQLGAETGDLNYAGYCGVEMIIGMYRKGDELDNVYRESEPVLDFMRTMGMKDAEDLLIFFRQFLKRMQGRTLNFGSFDDDGFALRTFERGVQKRWSPLVVCWLWIWRLEASYLGGDYRAAVAAGDEAKVLLRMGPASVPHKTFFFFHALALAAAFEGVAPEEKAGRRAMLDACERKIRRWAEVNPRSFRHIHSLVEAEMARIDGLSDGAARLYEEGIRGAREGGFVQDEALAHELAAKFWLARGFEDFARLYINKAYDGYSRLKAWGKVKALAAQFPQWTARDERCPEGAEPYSFDLPTVLKATQAISGEMEPERLLDVAMRLIIENAGAQMGFLVQEETGGLGIVARCDSEKCNVFIDRPQPIEESSEIAGGIVRYVARTKERVILDSAADEGMFIHDPFIRRHGTASLLCTPLLSRGRLIGIVYLKNDLTTHAFTLEKVKLLEIILLQIAISLENAGVYEALRASEEQLRALVDTSPVAIGVLDQAKRIIFVNRKLKELLGYTLEEIPTLEAWWPTVYPDADYREKIKAEWSAKLGRALATKSEIEPMEATVTCKDGSRRYIDFRFSAVGERFYVVLIDITERKRAEEALRQQLELLNLAHDAILVLDESYRLIFWNEGAERIYGWTRVEAIGRVAPDLLRTCFPVPLERIKAQVAETNLWEGELIHLRKDGREIIVESRWAGHRDLTTGLHFTMEINRDITKRKRALEALQTSEKKFRTLYETMIDAYASVDMAGKFLEFNSAYRNLTGYSDAEIRTLTYKDITPQRWHAAEAKVIEEQVLARGFSDIYEKEYRRKDGSVIPVELRTILIRDDAGRASGMWAIVRDITERKRAQEALRESEEKFRSLFMAVTDAIVVHDAETGRILEVNDAAISLYGYSREEFLAIDVLTLSAERQETAATIGKVRAGGAIYRVSERLHRKKDGRVFSVEVAAGAVRMGERQVVCAVFRDITERKRAEEELRRREQWFRSLAENLPDTVFRLDRQLRYIYVNCAVMRLTGLPRDSFIGKSLRELGYPEDSVALHEKNRRLVFETGKPLVYQFAFPFAKGIRIFEGHLAPEFGPNGEVETVLVVNRDITERVEAEKRLRESKDRLQLALAAGNHGLYDFDIPKGSAVVNAEYETMLGYQPGELSVTLDWWHYSIHPDDRERAWSTMNGCVAGATLSYRMEYRMRTKAGGWKWILCQGKNLEYDTQCRPVRMIGTHTDITERKEAEESLEKMRNILSEGQRIAHLGTFEYVTETKTTIWSEEEYRIYGFDPTAPSPGYEVMLAESIHPDDAALVHKTFTAAMQSGSVFELEHRIVRPDGSVRWVYDRAHPYFDRNGTIVRYVGATLDITERKHAEESLNEEREFLRKVIDTAPGMIFLKDWDGRYVLANKALCDYYGTTLEGLIGKTDADFVKNGEEAVRLLQDDREVMRTRHEKRIPEEPVTTLDGQTRWFTSIKVPLINDNGTCDRILGVAVDITERKEIREELFRLNAELEKRVAERTAQLEVINKELEAFSYSVSHDLRAPLRHVREFSKALQVDYGERLDAQGKDYLQRVVAASRRMERLIDDLLELSHLSRGNTQRGRRSERPRSIRRGRPCSEGARAPSGICHSAGALCEGGPRFAADCDGKPHEQCLEVYPQASGGAN